VLRCTLLLPALIKRCRSFGWTARRRDAKAHRLLADHVTAEYHVKTLARDRTVDEWNLRPTRRDNQWLDCLVGCVAAASIQGAALAGIDARSAAPRRRVRLSALQKQKR